LLPANRCVDRCDRVCKSGMEPITCGLDHIPAPTLDRVAEQLVVTGEDSPHRLGMVLPQTRGTLDIREEEGDRAGGLFGLPRTSRPGS
jgi:hypothetical protein